MRFPSALLLLVLFVPSPSRASASFCADVGQRELTLYLIDQARLPDAARTILMTEVTEIWRPAGVAVQWHPAPSGGEEDAGAGVYVIVVPETEGLMPDQKGRGEGLALIRFSNGRAHRHIYASVGATTRIISRDMTRPRLDAAPPRLAQQRLARALGRAVAHEVGHYLANSPEHAPRGLMRPSHRSTELIAQDLRPFQVDLSLHESGSCAK
jgi:hypothetical protein